MYYIYADDKLLYHPSNEGKLITSPKLTLEIGKAGLLKFNIPPTHSMAGSLRKLKTSIVVESDDHELFRGRILSEGRKFNNVKSIYCEGNLAYLVDSVQKAEAFEGSTHELFRKIIANHNARVEPEKRFLVGDITIENRSVIISGQSDVITDAETDAFDYKQIAINATTNEWVTTYDYISSCLIEYCGGYLRARRETNGTYIDYLIDYGSSATQEIEFGVNLLDLTEEVTVEDLFTVLIPLGDDNLTIASVNNGSDELVDETAVQLYGRIVRTHVFDNVTQASTLYENGVRYLNSNVNVPITITIKAVDLHLLNPYINEIHVGDRVHVKSIPHNIVDYLTCTRIDYDLENPANTVYTFGNPKQTLTQRYRKDIQKTEDTATGGGGSAGGAGAAAEASTSKANAWCMILKEEAFASIGASNERIDDMKNTLITECGIDFDGNTGNINIRSLKSVQDEHGNTIAKQGAHIDLLQEETESRIELVTSRVQTLEGVESGHYAELIMYANDLESAIGLKADRVSINAMLIELNALKDTLTDTNDILRNQVGIVLDGSKGNVNIQALNGRVDELGNFTATNAASIETLANDTGSKITLLTKSVGDLDTKTASIELRTSSLESEIEMKADNVTITSEINGVKSTVASVNRKITTINSEITTINSEITNVRKLIADEISAMKADVTWLSAYTIHSDVGVYAPFIRASMGMSIDGKSVATQQWVKDHLSEKAYLTALPDYIKVPTLSATSNMYFQGWTVATQKWVKEYLASFKVSWDNISGKPSYFPAKSHRHSFEFSKSLANGHTHKVTVNGSTYTSTGVSTNATHSLSVSGNTGYTGG